jgi:hypothetical protein
VDVLRILILPYPDHLCNFKEQNFSLGVGCLYSCAPDLRCLSFCCCSSNECDGETNDETNALNIDDFRYSIFNAAILERAIRNRE